MAAPRFGTDGVRGAANTELSVEAALSLGRAAALSLGAETIAVGRDTRISGQMLEAALVAGITSVGVDVQLLGIVPTPAVAYAAKIQSAGSGTQCAGAMISASHNPFGDNGIKLFAPGGLKLSDAVEAQIEDRYVSILNGDSTVGSEVGVVSEGWDGDYVVSLLNSVPEGALSSLDVVIDAANGSAAGAGPNLFQQLCRSVTVIGAEPDGRNINDGIGSTHPEQLQQAVVARGAHLGLAFDGDADRVLAVDNNGTLIDGDRILAILANDWKAQGRLAQDTVVVTVMSNLGFKKAMEAADINVIETGVGDRYVLEALNGGQLSLGGEQSGHVICRDLATTGDGMLAGIQLMDALVRSGGSLADLAGDCMTSFPQVLKNLRLEKRDPTLLEALAPKIQAAEEQLGDNGRVLVRLSGTEPLVRVMVEASTAAEADQICDDLIAEAASLQGIQAG